jgi:hypothetical protein
VTTSGGKILDRGRDPASGLIQYGTGSHLGTPTEPDRTTIEGRCYHDWFDQIEYVYQTSDPTVLAAIAAQATPS